MTYYAIIAEDNPDSLPKRAKARETHLLRLELLQQQDRLLLAGPFPIDDQDDAVKTGFSGSLIIAKFDSLNDAQLWADADPYVAAGVYKNVVVKPFMQVLP